MKIVVYEEPSIVFCQPIQNLWHLPAIGLKKELQEEGFEVLGEYETQPKEEDFAIYMDTLLRPKHPMLHKKSLYISLEPPVVNPRFYEKIKGWPYNRILTFSRKHCHGDGIQWLPYPCVRYDEKVLLERDSGRLCGISSNITKFHGRPGELYSVRRALYLSLGNKCDLYGKDWDKDREITASVNYKGICDSNYETFSKYKYAISIENMFLEGYASEKYFTPIQAGCELIRIGWNPDYGLSHCDQDNWGKLIKKHIMDLI